MKSQPQSLNGESIFQLFAGSRIRFRCAITFIDDLGEPVADVFQDAAVTCGIRCANGAFSLAKHDYPKAKMYDEMREMFQKGIEDEQTVD